MDHWILYDIRRRREELRDGIMRAALLRQARPRRSGAIRSGAAHAAQSLSDILEGLAQSLREHEA